MIHPEVYIPCILLAGAINFVLGYYAGRAKGRSDTLDRKIKETLDVLNRLGKQ